ncbi:P-loop NTPase fold protein [Paenibacillus amylolyticus]|uniref:KAP family P-loop NTPase fold protein n=1 Tax=Paenibacillus amylolyticus TaxID=1451 RepID=UPI0032420B8E
MDKRLTFNEDDRLDREPIADQLTKLILNSEQFFDKDNSLSIALDSPWGTGKSTFLEMWKNKLLEEQRAGNLKVVTYNAWYDDDFDIPLIPIIHELSELFPEEEQKRNFKKISISLANHVGKGMLKKALEHFFGVSLETLIDTVKDKTGLDMQEAIKNLSDTSKTDYFTEYKQFKEIKQDFRKQLSIMGKDQKVVFLIDELDRCRPTYAIETLETIKHFFDTQNLIFVVAMDMEQLKHSISTIYGANMDSYGYLRRFFDFNIRIPSPAIDKYIQHLDKTGFLGEEKLIEEIAAIFVGLNLTLRDMNVVFTNFNVVRITKLTDVDEDRRAKLTAYMYLTAMKHKLPNMYKQLIQGDYYLEHSDEENTKHNNYLPANYYNFSETVTELVQLLSQEPAQRKISMLKARGGKELSIFQRTLLIHKETNENITVSRYIENTLEMIE